MVTIETRNAVTIINTRNTSKEPWSEIVVDYAEVIILSAHVRVSGSEDLKSLNAPNAKVVSARHCSKLVRLDALWANSVDASDCPELTELHAPYAEAVWAINCPALTALHAPHAKIYR